MVFAVRGWGELEGNEGTQMFCRNMSENLGCILYIYLEWLTVDWIKQLKENNNK